MKLWLKLAAIAILFIFSDPARAASLPRYRCPGTRSPCIVMIGDSTVSCNTFQAPACTSKVLQQILKMQPRGYLLRLGGMDFRKAFVLNLAVAGTNTKDWATSTQDHAFLNGERLCDHVFTDAELQQNPGLKLVRMACLEGSGMADHIPALTGRIPDVVLVTLGVNNFGVITPEQTIIDYCDIRDTLAPAQVLFSSPFRVENSPHRQAFVDQITLGLVYLGIRGPNFSLYPFTTWDGVHLKEPGYAAAAGLWLQSIHDLPR